MTHLHPSYVRDMIQGARRYAQADKSDPFAFSRAMSHINSGVARPSFDGNGNRHDAYYDAQEAREKRVSSRPFSDGSTTYDVTVYRDMKRPLGRLL